MNELTIYPNRAIFHDGDLIELVIETNLTPTIVDIYVYHIAELVYQNKVSITEKRTTITLPALPNNQSYGVTCVMNQNKYHTAFEIYDSWKQIPRYGFLTDFYTEEKGNKSYLNTLLKCHINVVQYYDWMYKHEDLISPTSEFTDLMGRVLNQEVVNERIQDCKQKNIASMAYGAIYGASNDFYNQHQDWALFSSNHEPIRFIDVFTIMNFTEDSPWQTHIIDEFTQAIRYMGFDGIHLDTYGYPKIAKDYIGNTLYLNEHFTPFINQVKQQLIEQHLSSELIFNNVGSWPIQDTARAKQSALYIEVWDPLDTYQDLANLVRYVKGLTKEKELIISAYLKPYYKQDKTLALPAHKLLYSLLSGLGSHHLILGEKQNVLRTGYYCDYGTLTDDEFEEIRQYYDFNAQFSEILYDKTMNDVSFTHTFGDNLEYVLDHRCQVSPKDGFVYTIIKENKSRKILHLINLTNQTSTNWNEEKLHPEIVKDIKIQILTVDPIESIIAFSPEHMKENLQFTTRSTDRGQIISFTIPELLYWDMVILTKKESTL